MKSEMAEFVSDGEALAISRDPCLSDAYHWKPIGSHRHPQMATHLGFQRKDHTAKSFGGPDGVQNDGVWAEAGELPDLSRGLLDVLRVIEIASNWVEKIRQGPQVERPYVLDRQRGQRSASVSLTLAGIGIGTIDALAALQVLTPKSLHVPNELTQSDVSSIVEAGRLVRGEEITKTWSKLQVPVRVTELDEALAMFSGPGLGLEGDFSLTIGEVELELGRFHKRYRSIAPLDQTEVRRLAGDLEPDEMVMVEIRPGGDDRVDVVPRPLFDDEPSLNAGPPPRPAERTGARPAPDLRADTTESE